MIAMGIVVVEVCDGNAITTLNIEEIIEAEFPEVAVLMNECLSFCGLCRVRPYALVTTNAFSVRLRKNVWKKYVRK